MPKFLEQVAAAAALVVVSSATPVLAAPVPSAAILSSRSATDPILVHYRGGGWAAAGIGFAAGAILGSALAPRYYGYGYYGPPYAYGPRYYYAPRYYGVPAYRGGYPGCDFVDSSGVTSFENC